MKLVLGEGEKYMLRFDVGEDVIDGIRQFCEKNGIKSAAFSGIGTTQEIILSWYNTEAKHYQDHTITRKFEAVGLIGNVAIIDGRQAIHCHGSFSEVDLHTRSGHVKKMIVSATCEVFLCAFRGEITRVHDPQSGLSLMK